MNVRKDTILVVDDTPHNLRLLVSLLSKEYEVLVASDGTTALSTVNDQMPDLILLDVMMPNMNGFEFAEAVRGGGVWKEVPMVALSSHATEKDFARGREVGFDDYVAKFDRDALVDTLSSAVSSVVDSDAG